MTPTNSDKLPITAPANVEIDRVEKNGMPGKVERALEIRKSSAKAREGKPLAFPTRRTRPT